MSDDAPDDTIINQDELSRQKQSKIDPHILATPTIADINGDGIEEEIVMVISWYFDKDDIKLVYYFKMLHILKYLK